MYKILIINVLLSYFLLSTAYSQHKNDIRQATDTLVGKLAPDFKVSTIDSLDYQLIKLKGKIIVLNFWFMGCTPCVREFPELNQLVVQYKNNPNVLFLGISVEGKAETMKLFLKRKPFDYQIIASDFSIAKAYGVNFYPTNIVIDKQGKIVFAKAGYDDKIKDLLSEQIEKCLKD